MTDKIAVDFDKTITTGEGEPYWKEDSSEKPNKDLIRYINEQYKKGATIIVWTARPWSQAKVVAGWLTMWGVMWHGIRCEKGGADMYIDDKSHQPTEVLPRDMRAVNDMKADENDMRAVNDMKADENDMRAVNDMKADENDG